MIRGGVQRGLSPLSGVTGGVPLFSYTSLGGWVGSTALMFPEG